MPSLNTLLYWLHLIEVCLVSLGAANVNKMLDEADVVDETDTTRGAATCIFKYNSTAYPHGEIVSPNYPGSYHNNLNCRYEFYGLQNERVILQVEDFSLEEPQSNVNELRLIDYLEVRNSTPLSVPGLNTTTTTRHTVRGGDHAKESIMNRVYKKLASSRQCFFDYLDVFTVDGMGRLYWRSRHCGTQIDSQIVSTSPTLILIFKTDRMLNYRGFKFRFHFSYINILPFVTDPECGPSEIDGNGSTLLSPNYPQYFPYSIECAWTITVEKHQNILIKFVDVNLNQPCQISYLSIWDGYVNDVTTPDMIVCEKLIYYHKGILQYKSKSNRLVLKFVANKMSNEESARNIKSAIRKAKIDDFLHNKSLGLHKKNPEKYGFLLSWTGIHLADECGTGYYKCKGGESCIDSKRLLCQKTHKYCISERLLCDGVHNCDVGDRSDEDMCNLRLLTTSHLLTLAVFAACLVFCVLCVASLLAALLACRVKQQRAAQQRNSEKLQVRDQAAATDSAENSPAASNRLDANLAFGCGGSSFTSEPSTTDYLKAATTTMTMTAQSPRILIVTQSPTDDTESAGTTSSLQNNRSYSLEPSSVMPSEDHIDLNRFNRSASFSRALFVRV